MNDRQPSPLARYQLGMTGMVLLLAILSGAGGTTPSAPFCTLIGPGPGLRAEATAVLAVAADDWPSVSAQVHPYLASWKSKFRGSSFRAEGDRLVETEESIEEARVLAEQTLPGQQFVVLDVHRASQLDVGVGDHVTIIPWGYLPSCAYRPFEETEWVRPGDTVVFQLQQTRDSDAWVFDVTASHDPYPAYVWDSRPRLDDGSLASPWLSPTQHWEFLQLFPRPFGELSPPDQAALEVTVSTWARENRLSDSYPARDWLERRERARGN